MKKRQDTPARALARRAHVEILHLTDVGRVVCMPELDQPVRAIAGLEDSLRTSTARVVAPVVEKGSVGIALLGQYIQGLALKFVELAVGSGIH